MLLRYLLRYRSFVLRFRILCSTISVFLFRIHCQRSSGWIPAWYWTHIAVCTLHCKSIITRGSCAARAAVTGSRRSGGCTRRCGRTGRTGRSTGRSRRSALGPAEYICWSERSCARTSRVRHGEPGSRVAVAVAAVGKVPVAAYCEPQPWSEPWEQSEFAWMSVLDS